MNGYSIVRKPQYGWSANPTFHVPGYFRYHTSWEILRADGTKLAGGVSTAGSNQRSATMRFKSRKAARAFLTGYLAYKADPSVAIVALNDGRCIGATTAAVKAAYPYGQKFTIVERTEYSNGVYKAFHEKELDKPT